MKYSNLLIIDDDLDDQEIFCSALNQVSPHVACLALTNGMEALRKLKAKELNPDAIFLDLNMPIMSGQEFLIEIKQIERLDSIPVIIFTTSASPATIQETKELGAADFITKPHSYDELVKIITAFFNN
jgi:CheY-like chemotaxis protein